MSRLGKFRTMLVIAALLGLLVVVSARAAMAAMIDGEELVDPTAPFTLAAPASTIDEVSNLFSRFTSYRLNSILIRPNLKIAVVNSKRVGIGDVIGNATVTDIQPGKVTLTIDGEESVIELYEKSVKSSSQGE